MKGDVSYCNGGCLLVNFKEKPRIPRDAKIFLWKIGYFRLEIKTSNISWFFWCHLHWIIDSNLQIMWDQFFREGIFIISLKFVYGLSIILNSNVQKRNLKSLLPISNCAKRSLFFRRVANPKMGCFSFIFFEEWIPFTEQIRWTTQNWAFKIFISFSQFIKNIFQGSFMKNVNHRYEFL